MCIMGVSPLTAVVPFALLLTLSFFVLVALRKLEEKALKAFGYVVAGLLCFAALVVFLGTPYNMSRSPMKMKYMIRQKMNTEGMPQMMQKGSMPGMAMPGKEASSKEQKRPVSKCGGNKGIISKTE